MDEDRKVKLPLCVTKHNAMKIYGRVGIYLYAFLTLAPEGGEWSGSCFGCFTSREGAPGTN